MIDGLLNDDRFIIIEDELLAFAKNLTKAAHSAEYLRLQALATSKQSSNRSHHIDHRVILPESVKRAKDLESKRTALRDARGEKVDDQITPSSSSGGTLNKLMNSTVSQNEIGSQSSPRIVYTAARADTRAAAGFKRQTQTDHVFNGRASSLNASTTNIKPNVFKGDRNSVLKVADEDETFDEDDTMDESDDDDLDRVAVSKKPQLMTKLPVKDDHLQTSKLVLEATRAKQITRTPLKPILKPRVVESSSDEDFLDEEEATRWRRRREADKTRKGG